MSIGRRVSIICLEFPSPASKFLVRVANKIDFCGCFINVSEFEPVVSAQIHRVALIESSLAVLRNFVDSVFFAMVAQQLVHTICRF